MCLLDADGGGAHASLSLEPEPRYTLKDMILDGVALDDVLVRTPQGFELVPGSAGSDWMEALTSAQLQHWAVSLRQLDHYDFVLIDSATSTARNVLSFAQTSPEVILVITPAPISLPDAYSLLKLLSSEYPSKRIHVVVNKSINHIIGRYSYSSFMEVANVYLGMQLPLLGVVSEDPDLQALLHGQPVPVAAWQAAAARDIGSLADQLLVENTVPPEQGMQRFCDRYLKALGVKDSERMAAAYVLKIPGSRNQKLRQQIEYLSKQVDDLIQEIERLRQAPDAAQRTLPAAVTETSLAALASDSEAVTLLGETFSIYSRQHPSGGRQYFAWHSLDDCPETSGPVTATVEASDS